MTENQNPPMSDADVYEVVQAFAAASEAAPDDRALLRQWTRRFPQFADDLSALAYARFAFGWSLDDAVEDAAAPEKTPLTDLVADAKACGLTPADFARALRLDTVLLARLNQRLLDAAGLPRALAEGIAQTLDRSFDEVAAYLRGGPRLASGAHYRARKAPAVTAEAGPRQTFAEALQAAASLSADDKTYWLTEMEKGNTLDDE